jgi:two-component system, cell cycle sensor histidine kinase and response regulator CckA
MICSFAKYGTRASAEVEDAGDADPLTPWIERTDRTIVQFVQDLEHQLTVLISCVRTIDDDVAHDRTDRLGELQNAAEQAALLIDALLMNDRPEDSVRSVADVNEAVRVTAAALSQIDDAISVQLDISPKPLGVHAEPGALERVLLNLALNAYDAMPTGGRLTIETAVAHLRVGPIGGLRPGPYARLTVTDTGCGMTAEAIDRSFNACFTTKPNGTGLGLRSVAVTVQQLQGGISIESERGRGTSLTVLLPLAVEPSTQTGSLSAAPHGPRR